MSQAEAEVVRAALEKFLDALDKAHKLRYSGDQTLEYADAAGDLEDAIRPILRPARSGDD